MPVQTTSPLAAFLYELMRDHVPFGVLEKIIEDEVASVIQTLQTSHYLSSEEMPKFVLSNSRAGNLADDLADKLTADVALRLRMALSDGRRLRQACDEKDAEIQKLNGHLATEREALAEFLTSRINQQTQASTQGLSDETKRMLEIEVSFLKRYRDIVLEGRHRPDPELLGHVK